MKRCSTWRIREKQIKTTVRNWNPCAVLIEIKNGAATMVNSTAIPQKTKNRITIWSRNLNSGCVSQRTESSYLYSHVHKKISHKNHKAEATQVSSNEWLNKIWYIHKIKCFQLGRKRGNSDTHYNMDESWKHYANWKQASHKKTNTT